MVNDFVFRAYVMNRDLVKEGYPAGEWVDFPIKHDADIDLKEAVNEVLCRIRLDGMRYNQYLIADYDSDIAGLKDCLGKHENLFLLNYLAQRLQDMSCSMEQFEAMLAYGKYTGSIEELINLVDNYDSFLFMPDVKNDYDLGVTYAGSSEQFTEALKSLGMLSDYIDYEGYGCAVRKKEGGIHTDTGYIVQTDSIRIYFNMETDGIPKND